VVYAKRPFAGPEQVFKYLGQYTHRVGISNYRLVSFDERGVCFRTKNGKQVTVAPAEFIHRFLLHVLPNAVSTEFFRRYALRVLDALFAPELGSCDQRAEVRAGSSRLR